jgi:hypothetical protein
MYVPELMPRDPPEPGGPCRRLDDPLQQPGRVARASPGRGEDPRSAGPTEGVTRR